MSFAYDLRSDTVTRPTDAMRRAMAEARVGDDVWGDDPTVKALEAEAAELLGKEAALFFPSGTMANLAALMVHAAPGTEVYLGASSHVYYYESGGLSRIAGLLPRLFDDADGMPHPEALAALGRPADVHFPKPGLLCLENTHNRAGGTAASAARTEAVASWARAAGVPVHLDGARLLHAAAARGESPAALAAAVDSVMLSLSKALSAPVGSVLAGKQKFIDAARRVRKLLGGGMRQAGVLAAPGRLALATPLEELKAQHAAAKALAERLSELDGLRIDPGAVETNIVLVRLEGAQWADDFVARLARRGVGAASMGGDAVRFVTHRHVPLEVMGAVVEAVRETVAEGR